MERLLLALFALVLWFLAMPIGARADLINPDFYAARCKPGEQEVIATYVPVFGSNRHGPNNDQTKKYASNPDYYELSDSGRGSVKYCRKAGTVNKLASTWKIIALALAVAYIVIGSIVGLYLVRRRVAHK